MTTAYPLLAALTPANRQIIKLTALLDVRHNPRRLHATTSPRLTRRLIDILGRHLDALCRGCRSRTRYNALYRCLRPAQRGQLRFQLTNTRCLLLRKHAFQFVNNGFLNLKRQTRKPCLHLLTLDRCHFNLHYLKNSLGFLFTALSQYKLLQPNYCITLNRTIPAFRRHITTDYRPRSGLHDVSRLWFISAGEGVS